MGQYDLGIVFPMYYSIAVPFIIIEGLNLEQHLSRECTSL